MRLRPRRFAPARLILLAASIAVLSLASTASAAGPQMSVGWDHFCSLADDGTVKCWGYNDHNELGAGLTGPQSSPVTLNVLSGISQTMATADSTCALLLDATARCWGMEYLGNGVSTGDDAPQTVVGLTGIQRLFGEGNNTNLCALLASAQVACWGSNSSGQLGMPVGPVTTPTIVPGLANVKQISFGDGFGCALSNDGTVSCMGADGNGQLGLGATDQSTATPTAVPGLAGVTEIFASGKSTCALVSDGRVHCWGLNDNGQIGLGSIGADVDSPVLVPSLSGIVSLSGSYRGHCALNAAGTAYCWGGNGDGELGSGSAATNSPTPVAVSGLTDIYKLSGGAGADAICAIRRGGAVFCWGDDSWGNLGHGEPLTGSNVPVPNGVDLVTQAHPALIPAVTMTGKPKVDRRKRNYTVKGAFTAGLSGWVAPVEACAGNALVTVKYSYKKKRRGKNVKRFRTVKTKPVFAANQLGGCIANYSLKLPVKYLNKKTITVKASFAGNGALQPVNVSVKKRLPKVRVKTKR